MSTRPSAPPYPRPLSPHLQVYRLQITSVLSILHRFTGLCLSLGTIPLVVWLGGIAMGPGTYLTVSLWFSSPFGITMLLGWAFCFYFHLANGIRHLFWDMGLGYGLTHVYRSGWVVIVFTTVFTVLTFCWMVH